MSAVPGRQRMPSGRSASGAASMPSAWSCASTSSRLAFSVLTRRSTGARDGRPAFLPAAVRQSAAQFRFQPLGIFALHRQAVPVLRAAAMAARSASLSGGRAIAAGEIALRILALGQQRGDDQRAGRIAAHPVRQMGMMALDGKDPLGDGAAVARSGKAMAAEPGLELAVEGLGGISAPEFRSGLQPGGGGHGDALIARYRATR